MIYLTGDPGRQIGVDGSGGAIKSNWNAANNPMIFSAVRKDLLITNCANSGGFVQVVFANTFGSLIPAIAAPQVGDILYINSGVYKGNYAIKYLTGSTSTFIIDTPFTSNTAGGYANFISAIKNYAVAIELHNVILPSSYQEPIFFQVFPSPDGTFEVDPREYLKPQLGFKNTFDYQTINQADSNLSNIYVLGFFINWTDSSGENQSTGEYRVPTIFYITNSAKQIQDKYGQNMGEYVPLASGNIYNPLFDKKLGGWVTGTVTGGTLFKIDPRPQYQQAIYRATSIGSGELINNKSVFTAGKTYTVKYKVTTFTNGVTIQASIGTADGPSNSVPGNSVVTYTDTIVATGTGTLNLLLTIFNGSTNTDATVQFCSVVGLPYNAKFLTEFPRPTYFTGYPFELNFIYSEFLHGLQINKNEQKLDVNGNILSNLNAALDSTQEQYINHLALAGGYDCGSVDSINFWLEYGGSSSDNCYIDAGYWQDDYTDCEVIDPTGGTGQGKIPTGPQAG